jgi:hypothetical protein
MIDPVAGHVVPMGSVIVAKDFAVVAPHHRPSVMVGSRLVILHHNPPDAGESLRSCDLNPEQSNLPACLSYGALNRSAVHENRGITH